MSEIRLRLSTNGFGSALGSSGFRGRRLWDFGRGEDDVALSQSSTQELWWCGGDLSTRDFGLAKRRGRWMIYFMLTIDVSLCQLKTGGLVGEGTDGTDDD